MQNFFSSKILSQNIQSLEEVFLVIPEALSPFPFLRFVGQTFCDETFSRFYEFLIFFIVKITKSDFTGSVDKNFCNHVRDSKKFLYCLAFLRFPMKV